MTDREPLVRTALAAGFTAAGILRVETLRLLPEVRGMCSNGSCHQYGRRWSCPPGCGTLEECRSHVQRYRTGLLVQTIGILEDEFDGEGMMAAEGRHKEHFQLLKQTLSLSYPKLLALGAGCCEVCPVCTYPDAACRFPERMISSMEAYGLLVRDICEQNGLLYYHGRNTITYTGCFLLEAAEVP